MGRDPQIARNLLIWIIWDVAMHLFPPINVVLVLLRDADTAKPIMSAGEELVLDLPRM